MRPVSDVQARPRLAAKRASLKVMPDFVVIGTDTDVGKTTFALLWLNAFADWYTTGSRSKTGPSDSHAIKACVPTSSSIDPFCTLKSRSRLVGCPAR